MKARKFFSMFMIAAAICTTGFMMTSCHDEDDVVEVKYKTKTVNVESSEVYQTHDAVDVQITYNVVAEVSCCIERTESEWVNLIKKDINKEVNYVVRDIKFENISKKIFDDIYYSLNNKDYTLGEFKVNIKKEEEAEIEEPVEDKWENINSVSIEEGTLFTSRHKLYVNEPDCYYIWSKDWTGYHKLKVKTCEIKYSNNLEIDSAKVFLFEKVNVAVSDYIGGLVMKDLYLTSGERRIDVFLDNVLIECEKHIKTLFNMENDNFEIVDFEIMKGAAKNYWINSCALHGDTSGYDYKYIYNAYKEWKDNR